jgi:hypothetical protein
MVLASHLVIRWKYADFTPASSTSASGIVSGISSPTSATTKSSRLSTAVSEPDHSSISVLPSSVSGCQNCTQASPISSHSKRPSTGGLVGAVLGSLLGFLGATLGILMCLSKRRKWPTGTIELDDRGQVGCRVLYEPPTGALLVAE